MHPQLFHARLTWVGERFLIDNKVTPWEQLPLWLPPDSVPADAGFVRRVNSKALKLGLTLRPVTGTIAATLDGLRSSATPAIKKNFGNILPQPGLTADLERELLRKWRARP